jgi:hypothetical protein
MPSIFLSIFIIDAWVQCDFDIIIVLAAVAGEMKAPAMSAAAMVSFSMVVSSWFRATLPFG